MVSAIFSKDRVKAQHMAYVDDADSPTTETEDFEGSDCEGSEAGRRQRGDDVQEGVTYSHERSRTPRCPVLVVGWHAQSPSKPSLRSDEAPLKQPVPRYQQSGMAVMRITAKLLVLVRSLR